jgi:hypothetical protein
VLACVVASAGRSGLSLAWQWLGMAGRWCSSAQPTADRAPGLLLPYRCCTAAADPSRLHVCGSILPTTAITPCGHPVSCAWRRCPAAPPHVARGDAAVAKVNSRHVRALALAPLLASQSLLVHATPLPHRSCTFWCWLQRGSHRPCSARARMD